MEAFFMDDLFDEPDYIEKIMDIIQEAQLKRYRKMMEEQKPIAVWIGGWRSTPEIVSPAIFDRFVWPYLKDFANLCLEMSVVPMFHLDANWDSQLKRFLEIPEKSSVMCLDSKTNIRLAREVLGDHMCILGDVPANMQAFKKYEDVYAYVTAVIDDIGPYGYIAASGCDIPINAKRECVKAISDAAHQYKIMGGFLTLCRSQEQRADIHIKDFGELGDHRGIRQPGAAFPTGDGGLVNKELLSQLSL